MLKMDTAMKRFEALDSVPFAAVGLKECEHLRECIFSSPDAFFGEVDEDLLIIGKEVKPSEEVGDSIDLLAVGGEGESVIIELKRGSNKWQLLQALAYAAMVSKWGPGESFLARVDAPRRDEVKDFIRVEAEDLNRSQRVVLVAESYDYEVLITAEWLSELYGVRISCCQISMAQDKQAQYLSCTKLFPPSALGELSRQRGSGSGGESVRQKSWEELLARCDNAVAVEFFRPRFQKGLRTNRHGNVLQYPQIGTVRWNVSALRKNARVSQIGRFHGDVELWRKRLSAPESVGCRKNGAILRFYLNTPGDFAFFQQTMEQPPSQFEWDPNVMADGSSELED